MPDELTKAELEEAKNCLVFCGLFALYEDWLTFDRASALLSMAESSIALRAEVERLKEKLDDIRCPKCYEPRYPVDEIDCCQCDKEPGE